MHTTRNRLTHCRCLFLSQRPAFFVYLLLVFLKFYLFDKQESSADEGDEESERSKSEIHDDDEESGQVFMLMIFISFCWFWLNSLQVH